MVLGQVAPVLGRQRCDTSIDDLEGLTINDLVGARREAECARFVRCGLFDEMDSCVSYFRKSQDVWGISGAEVPAIALETNPGDVVVFNFATKHSAWGGGQRRRMFTINVTAHYQPDDVHYLKDLISGAARFWIDSVYGERMLRTATPERMIHLQQSLDNQGHLPEEVRKARLTMSEPSRG